MVFDISIKDSETLYYRSQIGICGDAYSSEIEAIFKDYKSSGYAGALRTLVMSVDVYCSN